MTVEVTVLACGHDVADARVHRLCAALVRAGLRVEVLGLGSAPDGPPECVVRAMPRPGLLGRLLLGWTYAVRARGRVLLAVDPDGLVAARVVGRARGRTVVADVHEDYARLIRDRSWAHGLVGWAARQGVRIATGLAAGAALTVVADDHVPPLRARTRLVVPNHPDPRMLPSPAEVSRTQVPTAVYVGDVRTSRGLRSMLEAVAMTPPWRLMLVGPVAQDDAAWVAERVAQPDLKGRVDLLGRRAPQEAWALAAGAWCGLALLQDTPAFREAVPSKLYEYRAVGLPVVVSDLPRQREMARDGAGAVVSTDPERAARECSEVLRRWADPGLRDAAAAAARRSAGLPEAGRSGYDELAGRVASLVRARSRSAA